MKIPNPARRAAVSRRHSLLTFRLQMPLETSACKETSISGNHPETTVYSCAARLKRAAAHIRTAARIFTTYTLRFIFHTSAMAAKLWLFFTAAGADFLPDQGLVSVQF